MRIIHSVRNSIIRTLHKLTLLDFIILFVLLALCIFLFIFFKRENKIIEIRVKLTDPDIKNISLRALTEYAMVFHVGDKEYNELGQVVSEITRVDAYKTDPIRMETNYSQPQSQTVYINIRSKAVYNPRKKQYSIRGKPVTAGQSIVFIFSNAKVEGIIIDFPGFISTLDMPVEKKTVYTQLRDAQHFYSDTYGVPDYIAQAIHIGDVVTDSNGTILAKIVDIKIHPAKRTIVANNNLSSVIMDQTLKDVFITLEINSFKYGDRYYLYDYIPISIGQYLPLNFPLISILPTVIDIK